jgi:hypothetical protein
MRILGEKGVCFLVPNVAGTKGSARAADAARSGSASIVTVSMQQLQQPPKNYHHNVHVELAQCAVRT